MNTPAAIPGQYLGPASKFQPGPGTHLHNGNIWASVLGTISTSTPGLTSSQEQAEAPKKLAGPPKRLTRIAALAEPRDSPQSRSQALLPVISVCTAGGSNSRGENGEEGGGGGGGKREVLPEVDQTVLCRVMRIMPRQAVVNILVVNETNVLEGEWQGVIRVQDVRATEKDKVRMVESFRPGDIVRARVVSTAHMP
ncbi:putative exosomal core protein csl4 [Zalerion maritima]|uniref:Exosomal core protein csl4 n=1 Tax=Zalerion maritima TaxID=339359 RepID=A0AAD5RQJ8_9PEZI|nr:putative exosomal core protein csl4 [Zalerion maritima]